MLNNDPIKKFERMIENEINEINTFLTKNDY